MVKKTRIRIGLPTFAFFAVIFLMDFSLTSILPFLAALLHELGHITAMKMCGQNISEIKILPFGIDIKRVPSLSSYKTDIFVNSAGILTNILLILLCSALPESDTVSFFIASNILLIFVNILPIKNLDGGQSLEKLLALKLDLETAENIVAICSLICIILLGSVAVWLLFYTSYNFTLLLMCMYLFCGIFLK